MSRVCLASDTCDIYFTYIKVNHLLYTCSLDPFEDGILLDISLVCMRRYCQSFTDDDEECKRQETPTPSAREAWKRRRSCRVYSGRTTGSHRTSNTLQLPGDRAPSDVRRVHTQPNRRTDVANSTAPGRPPTSGRPTSPSHRTTDV